LAVAALLLGLRPGSAPGQDGAVLSATPKEGAQAAKPPATKAEKAKSRFPKFEDVVKDMKPRKGLFTLYRYDPADKSKDPEKLLCKIPADLLDTDLLFAISISRGGFFTGWMWTDYLIRWEVVGNHLKLVTPDTRYVKREGSPVAEVVRRTYNARYLASVPILTMTSSGDVVIDLGKLLKSDLADISFMGGRVRPELSRWTKTKVFPDNVLIDVDLALAGKEHGGKMVGVSYAFRRLPALGEYKPRRADDRIGYFITARVDWSKKPTARDTFERYIQRWKLEKRDPELELSPPKQPITFIIEKTVPIRWRRWVRQGILEWNKAFEKIGFVDAIVVQQQTKDNEFARYDPEDARYNFFRWIVSGSPFAMGPSRVDPRTGQILDADIIMDDSFVRAWMHDFDLFAPSTAVALKGPGFRMLQERYPDFAEPFFVRYMTPREDTQAQMLEMAERILRNNGRQICTYATGMQQQIALGYNALLATSSGKKLPEHFIGEAIREVVAHEVGHTLGLRHNFKASSWLTLEEIKQRRDTSDEPTSGSVMDYNPLLFFKDDKGDQVRHFVTPGIGPYDYWAIEYGYAVPPKGKSEEDMLKEIASRCTRPELAYATDEDTLGPSSPDPAANRYDAGSRPMDWIRSRFELCDQLTQNLLDWAIRDGEPRYHATRAFRTIWLEKARNFEYLARLVGGQYFHRDHKGDPGQRPAFVLVDAQTQREALQLLGQTLFNPAFFQVDPDLLNNLAPSRWMHFGSDVFRQRADFPIHDLIATLQWWTLVDLASPPVVQRIYDAELKCTDEDKFTAAEFVRSLRDTVWSELAQAPEATYDDANPYISSISRGLQRIYLDLMLRYVQVRPGTYVSPDLDGMIRFALRELSERIGQVLKAARQPDGTSRLDFASRAHLTESKSRIDRALEAQFAAR